MGQPLNVEGDRVFPLYSLFASEAEKAEMADMYRSGKIGYGGAKKALKTKIETYFAPFRDKRKQLEKDLATVEDILREGAKKARVETEATMDLVLHATGLRAS
jgi:tryptophanyl-tRNA synthetase